jgi:hypothetical protein
MMGNQNDFSDCTPSLCARIYAVPTRRDRRHEHPRNSRRRVTQSKMTHDIETDRCCAAVATIAAAIVILLREFGSVSPRDVSAI